mmetsp:Transcript_20017/g.56523  ORF Transcript_20017/g.56523 Transcript_20017/m.56523 type:complete len:997 (-) Transcript_20017:138-3128(-)
MEETLAEFRRFDLTGCGSMAREILACVLRECTELSGEAIDALIDTVDTDGTGRIKYEQFVVWLFGQEPPKQGQPAALAPDPEPPKEAPARARGHAREESVLSIPGSACSQEPLLNATASTCQPDFDISGASATSRVGVSRAATPAESPTARLGEGQICRYCLDGGNAEDLVSPCACRGSSSWVHVQCLLSYAKQQQQEHVGIDVTCPTCRTPYMGTAALRLLPLALEDVKRRHGARHVAVARVLKTMAGNHLSLMQFEEAKQCIEAATEMHRSLQDAPFDVAGEPIDMAEVLAIRIMIDQGMCAILQDAKWDAKTSAETVAQVESLLDEHYKHECGPDAPRVAGVLMSLCLGDSDRPVRQRIKMLQRALGLLEGYYGKDHADEYANTLNVLTTMAILAGEVGDFQTVKTLSGRAIIVQRRHSGPAHPTTLMSCCLLVCAQLKLGEIEEARVLLDQVISIAEQTEFMPALAPAMRVVRARLVGELGDVAEMRRECLRIVEEANSRSDLYTKLKGPEPACTLREAEAVLGRPRGASTPGPEQQERSHDSPGSDWEDQLRDLAVRVVLGEEELATAGAHTSARELQAALGADAMRVMHASIAYVRRFWERNLVGAPKARVQAWFESLAEYASALAYGRRACLRAAARSQDGGRLGRANLLLAAELAALEDGVQYGATRFDAHAVGDPVRSLINMASLSGWALQEGDEGLVEAPGPLHGCASIRFPGGTVVLPLTDVCSPRDVEERMLSRRQPCRGLAPGQRVRSLVSAACHPRPLARGLEGLITAVDRTRGRANVDFGGEAEDSGPRLRVTLLLSDVCSVDEFERKLETRRAASGGFFVGEAVRSLIFLPLQASRHLHFGAEGVAAMLDSQHRRVLVRFGGEEGLQVLVRFQDVCLPEDFEARTQERRAVLSGLMPGDRVRSLVTCQDWVPRPLCLGDEGTILMINPATNRALVDFAGEETLRGEMDPSSVCAAAEFEARVLAASARDPAGSGRPGSTG